MNTLTLKKENLIGLREFRSSIDKCVNALSMGKNFIVLRKNIPLFKVVSVDEWGDDGSWSKMISFNEDKKYPNGIPTNILLKEIKKIKSRLDKK